MKRKITLCLLTLVCALCSALALASCGGEGGGGYATINYVGLNEKSISIDIGEEKILNAQILPVNVPIDDFVYSAEPEGIVELKTNFVQNTEKTESQEPSIVKPSIVNGTTDGNARVTVTVKGIAYGNATVTVTAGGLSASCDVIVEKSTKGLEYQQYNIGDEMIMWCCGLGTATETDITVASVVDGIPVRRIDFPNEAECAKITGITVPDSVKILSLTYCTSLTSVDIPESVTDFNFYRCTSLKTVTIADSIKGIPDVAFNECTALEHITIPSKTTRIGNSAFMNCTSLKSITLPPAVTSIDVNAFRGCSNLERISIASRLSEVGGNAFYECDKLTTVEILQFNYTSNITMKDLFELDSPVSTVRTIKIAEGVTVIPKEAFRGCSYLTEVILPKSLTYIGEESFNYCNNLTTVKFEGTKKQWEQMDKHIYYVLSHTAIICTDGAIAAS